MRGRLGSRCAGKAADTDVTESSSTISLELDSKPQSVALARGMLSAVLELLGFDPELLDDAKMAVSEACNNVVLHAYGDGVGPMLVDLEIPDGKLIVAVRDRGIGLSGREPALGRLGVGVPMIQTLADHAQFLDAVGGGTEVRMRFGSNSRSARRPAVAPRAPSARPETPKPAGDVIVSRCPVPLLAGVMGRLAMIIAAAARFSLDRLSDVRLFTDAVAAQLQTTCAAPVTFSLATTPRRLELALGPFEPITAGRLIPERSSLTASELPLLLADEWAREPFHGEELVRAVITDPGAPGPTRGWVSKR
jgi:anti-sigma regulatory factor (Ser/Thr protein kinase)